MVRSSGLVRVSVLTMLGLNLLVAFFFLPACNSRKEIVTCSPSCGNISIRYPFRLQDDPINCGDVMYQLACDKNNRTVIQLDSDQYYVDSISYNNMTLRAVDPGIRKDDCSSFPRCTWPIQFYPYPFDLLYEYTTMILFDCSTTMDPSRYLDAAPCLNSSSSRKFRHPYVYIGVMAVSSLDNSCDYVFTTATKFDTIHNLSYSDIHREFAMGYEISWRSNLCGDCYYNRGFCFEKDRGGITTTYKPSKCKIPIPFFFAIYI